MFLYYNSRHQKFHRGIFNFMSTKEAYAGKNARDDSPAVSREKKSSAGSAKVSVRRLNVEAGFSGVLALNKRQWKAFEECMTNPREPTEAIKEAAKLHRELLQK